MLQRWVPQESLGCATNRMTLHQEPLKLWHTALPFAVALSLDQRPLVLPPSHRLLRLLLLRQPPQPACSTLHLSAPQVKFLVTASNTFSAWSRASLCAHGM